MLEAINLQPGSSPSERCSGATVDNTVSDSTVSRAVTSHERSQQRHPIPSSSKITSDGGLEDDIDESCIFDANLQLVRRYYYRDSQNIALLYRRANTEKQYAAIAEKKMATWLLVEQLSKTEGQSLSQDLSWLRPILGAILAIALAFLLFFGLDETTVLVYVLLLGYLSICFVSWLSRYSLAFEEYMAVLERVRNRDEGRAERPEIDVSLW
jgi:hypothetical protein